MSKNRNREIKQNQPEKQDSGAFALKDYFYINIFFWAFLVVVSVIVFFSTGAKWDPIMENVFTFIFLVFGLGFTAVSVFDAVYERVAKNNADEK
jgi:hypothetical protein